MKVVNPFASRNTSTQIRMSIATSPRITLSLLVTVSTNNCQIATDANTNDENYHYTNQSRTAAGFCRLNDQYLQN